MEFYDVGMGDLRELWESYMIEPALLHDVLVTNNNDEWGNVLSAKEKTSRGVVLRDRLMTDAALGGPRPIKSEHSYSMLATSPPASPVTEENNQLTTNVNLSSIQNEINCRKLMESKAIGLRTRIDDMEEECFPAISLNTATGRVPSSPTTNCLPSLSLVADLKHQSTPTEIDEGFLIKGEPISEPNSPSPSCIPFDIIENKRNITMVSPHQLHFNNNHASHTSDSEEDDEEYYQSMDVEFDNQDSENVQNRRVLPPTPPSSASSDSEGTSCSPKRRNSQSSPHVQNLRGLLGPRLYVTNSGHSTRQPIHTSLISCQPKGSTGILILTEEEKRTLIAEGYPVPTKLPLTKQEEKSLKKVRRKIKNKISAQESRRKKKEYMDGLERRVTMLTNENSSYRNRLTTLEDANRDLLKELQRLQEMVEHQPSS